MTFQSVFGSLSPDPFDFVSPAPEPTMWWWQGSTGHWYIHSIFQFSANIGLDSANYIFVRREHDGRRRGLYIGQSDKLSERLPRHEKFDTARHLGANELHVHLLAQSASERFRVETDLRNGQNPLLNDQGTPNVVDAIFGLAPQNPFEPQGLADILKALSVAPHRRS